MEEEFRVQTRGDSRVRCSRSLGMVKQAVPITEILPSRHSLSSTSTIPLSIS